MGTAAPMRAGPGKVVWKEGAGGRSRDLTAAAVPLCGGKEEMAPSHWGEQGCVCDSSKEPSRLWLMLRVGGTHGWGPLPASSPLNWQAQSCVGERRTSVL